MSEELEETASPDDMHGGISVDGFDYATVASLGLGCPRGFVLVGVTILAKRDEAGGDLVVIAGVAVDENILDGPPSPEAIRKYAQTHGHVPAFRVAQKAKLSDILPRLRRVSIVLQDSTTEGVKFVLPDGGILYEDSE